MAVSQACRVAECVLPHPPRIALRASPSRGQPAAQTRYPAELSYPLWLSSLVLHAQLSIYCSYNGLCLIGHGEDAVMLSGYDRVGESIPHDRGQHESEPDHVA